MQSFLKREVKIHLVCSGYSTDLIEELLPRVDNVISKPKFYERCKKWECITAQPAVNRVSTLQYLDSITKGQFFEVEPIDLNGLPKLSKDQQRFFNVISCICSELLI